MAIILQIMPLLGALIGGGIVLLANYLSKAQRNREIILDKQLSVYQEITTTFVKAEELVVDNILFLRQTLGAYDLDSQRGVGMSKKVYERKINKYFDNLENIYTKIYELFYYSHIVSEEVLTNMILSHKAISKMYNMEYIITDLNYTGEITSFFGKTIDSISHTIGVNRKSSLTEIPFHSSVFYGGFCNRWTPQKAIELFRKKGKGKH